MTEPGTTAAPAAPAQEPTQQHTTPPWGTEEQFDPARAWTLIENLRAEKAQLSARPTLTAEQQSQLSEYQQLVEASQSEAERQSNAVAAATREAETARAEALRYRIAAENGIGKDDLDLLGSGTEAQITARAQRIVDLRAAAQAAATPPPATLPVRRPVEHMRPGATPGEAESADDVTMAQLFGTGA